MRELPNEIIQQILSRTPRRDLVPCITTSRQWHQVAIHRFYDRIELNSLAQFKALLRCLSYGTHGSLVHHIRFNTAEITFTQDEFDTLARWTPNLLTCDYTVQLREMDQEKFAKLFVHRWKKLTLLPGWHADKPSEWMMALGPQLTQITLDSLRFHTVCCVTLLPANFSLGNLTTVTIKDFGRLPTNTPLLEALSQMCPNISTLTFDIMEPPEEDLDFDAVQPALSVVSLTISKFDPQIGTNWWFEYLQLKYPRLTYLSFKIMDDYIDGNYEDPTSTLYTLVKNLTDLESLHINLQQITNPQSDVFEALDIESFRLWLNTSPRTHRISSFSWFCPCNPFSLTSGHPYTMTSAATASQLSSFGQTLYNNRDGWLLDWIRSPQRHPVPTTTFDKLVTLDVDGRFLSLTYRVDMTSIFIRMPKLLYLTLRNFSMTGNEDPATKLVMMDDSRRCSHPLRSLHLCHVSASPSNTLEPHTLDMTAILDFCPDLDQLLLFNCLCRNLIIDCPQRAFSQVSILSFVPEGIQCNQVRLILDGKSHSPASESSSVINCKAIDRFDSEAYIHLSLPQQHYS
ncbi:hypothetical protein DM01DRAFT_1340220 [Hesseltinella vesiculosa]|uniref:F-box domain-containing protein n=1 Tax=Hesseltinella vesiculosa TaxID=101127 RepID=A0A1X2G4K8_9FUNG|nr:hypothetical protein DM01DRAFT_1340220 [Hesseltinella vesiculosa]